MYPRYIFLCSCLLVGGLNMVHGIECARCNSLTNADCAKAMNIPLLDCPPRDRYCLVYWSRHENIAENPEDTMVVRDCSAIRISTCATTGLRSPHVISCFRSCDHDGCNS